MLELMEEKETYLAAWSDFEKALGPADYWPHSLRAAAIERFAELGFPGPRDEDWKCTSLAPLLGVPFRLAGPAYLDAHAVWSLTGDTGADPKLVIANGRYDESLSAVGGLPAGVTVAPLADALALHGELVEPYLARLAPFEKHAFAALNTAFLRDGAFVHVARGVVLEEPLHLVFLSIPRGEPTVSYPRTLVVAEDNSQLTLVQHYAGPADAVYFTCAVTEIATMPGAHVDHYKIQRESLKAFHLDVLAVRQRRASNFRSHAVTLGGAWVRNEAHARFDAEGSECTLNGLYLAGGTQHVDNRTAIDHAKPHCASHELYRGILDGRARGVFNGKIFVRQDAQKTDAKQTNQTLLLSDDAVINTKPQLEIFADDVKCTHGATVGNLSADAVYYLRSRGIGLEAARGLLTFAFANAVLEGVRPQRLQEQLSALLLARHQLPAGLGEETL